MLFIVARCSSVNRSRSTALTGALFKVSLRVCLASSTMERKVLSISTLRRLFHCSSGSKSAADGRVEDSVGLGNKVAITYRWPGKVDIERSAGYDYKVKLGRL